MFSPEMSTQQTILTWNRPLHRFFRVLCASASRCNPPSEGKILFVQFFYAKVNNRVDRFALVHNHAMHFVIERFVRENFEAEHFIRGSIGHHLAFRIGFSQFVVYISNERMRFLVFCS